MGKESLTVPTSLQSEVRVAEAKPWLEGGEVAVNAPNSLFSSWVCSEVSAESLINPKQQPEGHEGPSDMKPFKSALWRCRRDNSKTTRIIEPPDTANVCSVQPLLPDEPKLFSFLFLFNYFFLVLSVSRDYFVLFS